MTRRSSGASVTAHCHRQELPDSGEPLAGNPRERPAAAFLLPLPLLLQAVREFCSRGQHVRACESPFLVLPRELRRLPRAQKPSLYACRRRPGHDRVKAVSLVGGGPLPGVLGCVWDQRAHGKVASE